MTWLLTKKFSSVILSQYVLTNLRNWPLCQAWMKECYPGTDTEKLERHIFRMYDTNKVTSVSKLHKEMGTTSKLFLNKKNWLAWKIFLACVFILPFLFRKFKKSSLIYCINAKTHCVWIRFCFPSLLIFVRMDTLTFESLWLYFISCLMGLPKRIWSKSFVFLT